MTKKSFIIISQPPKTAINGKKIFFLPFLAELDISEQLIFKSKIRILKKVSNAKSKGIFFQKKKLFSNDSEMSNSARNGKKNVGGKWRFSEEVALPPPFFQFSVW